MNRLANTVTRTEPSVLATNKVIRNTYILLSLFLTSRFQNSGLGLLFVFALTGFMGYTLGPILNAYASLPNGDQVVMTALGATGVIFLSLSGYALTSRARVCTGSS